MFNPKASAHYFPGLLTLTAIVLSLLAFLAPNLLLHSQVALLTVFPSTELVLNQTAGTNTTVDGPSVWLGPLGSCTRENNEAPITCTSPALGPQYNLTTLPTNAPSELLYAPDASTPVFISIGLAFDVVFFLLLTRMTIRRNKPAESEDGKMGSPFKSLSLLSLCLLVGFGGFMIGLTSFLVLRMWFGKTVNDFNESIQLLGSQGPDLIAQVGNAFTMAWVAHAFLGVSVLAARVQFRNKNPDSDLD